jgi:hypothetical protein
LMPACELLLYELSWKQAGAFSSTGPSCGPDAGVRFGKYIKLLVALWKTHP